MYGTTVIDFDFDIYSRMASVKILLCNLHLLFEGKKFEMLITLKWLVQEQKYEADIYRF